MKSPEPRSASRLIRSPEVLLAQAVPGSYEMKEEVKEQGHSELFNVRDERKRSLKTELK